MKNGIILLAFCLGCASTPPPPIIREIPVQQVPESQKREWSEEMHSQVKVPGKINGVIYIPPHEALVEIRPGRVQEVEYGY